MPDAQPLSDPASSAASGTPSSTPSDPHDVSDTPDTPDPLASLKKMSTTAGVGTQEYVAINPAAVLTAILGVASVLAVLYDLLLIIPLAAVVCGVVARRQVRDSNGTQTGAGLALLGIGLSLLIGGGLVAGKAFTAWTWRSDREVIAKSIRQLGDDISRRDYRAAYDLFSDRFKQHKSLDDFKEFWESRRHSALGDIVSMEWNGRLEPVDSPGTNARTAWAAGLIHFEQPAEAPRQEMLFTRVDGKWLIEDYPAMNPKGMPRQ